CYGLFGSGFFVSSNGYIVTNGHVAIPNSFDLLSEDLTQRTQLSLFWHDVINDGLLTLKSQGYNISSLTVDDLLTVGLKFTKYLMDNNYLTLTPTYQNYIEGDTPFNIDATSYNVNNGIAVKFIDGQVDSSMLIAINAANNQPTGITKPDVAILKLDGGSSYPALSLVDSKLVTTGEKIQVIGFPGSANNSSLFGTDTSRIATITNGTISAIKNNSTGAFKLLQIDASISHGNSGGPILNSDGQVVGIATYKINGSESADFNAGVSVEEISKLLAKNNIALTTGTTSQNISSGIDNFSKSYYKLAVTNFNEAVKAYPPTADVLNPMISIAQEKITQGQDQTPIINTIALENFLNNYGIHLSGYSTLILLIAVVGFLIFGAITITAVIINRRKMLSVKAPIIGNADLSVVNSQIKNNTDYSIPQTERPIDTTPVDPAVNQQIPPQSMPTPSVMPTMPEQTVTQVPSATNTAPTTSETNIPTVPANEPKFTEISGPAISTPASTSTVPVSLTSSYNPLPESQPTTPATPTTPPTPVVPAQ
ncbi:MAG TPA: trypsin-like peptidase domain-containing protein, partial [Candidatus Dojkabacteria bacterium]|nr:trypsin-like peptidase domain-containing protein [Candidatus Dojkabacteria bacterium]